MTDLVRLRRTCRLCGSEKLELCVPLAGMPIVSPNVGDVGAADETQRIAPLDIYLCRECGLTQLLHVVDPALIYRNYLYHTAVSKGLADHFYRLSAVVMTRLSLKPGDMVVEFGSNDGTLLSFFKAAGMAVAGVDPATAIAREATSRDIPTRADFFGARVAGEMRHQAGAAKAIIANNVVANIDDLDDVFEGVRTLLDRDGAFVFETQYALDVFERTLLDVIYHEHLSYFAVRPLVLRLETRGLRLFNVERIESKGGSVRFWVQRADAGRAVDPAVAQLVDLEERTGLYDNGYYRQFTGRIATIEKTLRRMIADVKKDGRELAAYGTSVGCAALIHQFDLAKDLDFLVDDSPFKDRLEGPGYDLPVLLGDALAARNPALVVILAWRYAGTIAARQSAYLDAGGKFVVPLPAISTLP